jgi:hypothetical protein
VFSLFFVRVAEPASRQGDITRPSDSVVPLLQHICPRTLALHLHPRVCICGFISATRRESKHPTPAVASVAAVLSSWSF